MPKDDRKISLSSFLTRNKTSRDHISPRKLGDTSPFAIFVKKIRALELIADEIVVNLEQNTLRCLVTFRQEPKFTTQPPRVINNTDLQWDETVAFHTGEHGLMGTDSLMIALYDDLSLIGNASISLNYGLLWGADSSAIRKPLKKHIVIPVIFPEQDPGLASTLEFEVILDASVPASQFSSNNLSVPVQRSRSGDLSPGSPNSHALSKADSTSTLQNVSSTFADQLNAELDSLFEDEDSQASIMPIPSSNLKTIAEMIPSQLINREDNLPVDSLEDLGCFNGSSPAMPIHAPQGFAEQLNAELDSLFESEDNPVPTSEVIDNLFMFIQDDSGSARLPEKDERLMIQVHVSSGAYKTLIITPTTSVREVVLMMLARFYHVTESENAEGKYTLVVQTPGKPDRRLKNQEQVVKVKSILDTSKGHEGYKFKLNRLERKNSAGKRTINAIKKKHRQELGLDATDSELPSTQSSKTKRTAISNMISGAEIFDPVAQDLSDWALFGGNSPSLDIMLADAERETRRTLMAERAAVNRLTRAPSNHTPRSPPSHARAIAQSLPRTMHSPRPSISEPDEHSMSPQMQVNDLLAKLSVAKAELSLRDQAVPKQTSEIVARLMNENKRLRERLQHFEEHVSQSDADSIGTPNRSSLQDRDESNDLVAPIESASGTNTSNNGNGFKVRSMSFNTAWSDSTSLANEVQMLKEKLKKSDAIAMQVESERDALRIQFEVLRRETENFRVEAAAMQSTVSDLGKQLEMKERILKSSQDQLFSALKDHFHLQTEIEQMRKVVGKYVVEQRDLKRKLNLFKTNLAFRQNELSSVKAQMEAQELHVRNQAAQIARLQSSIPSTSAVISPVHTPIVHPVKEYRVRFAPDVIFFDASLDGNFVEVEKLVEAGFDINSRNAQGITALHNACCNGHTDLVKYLVENGADVNALDEDGWTPLHSAACTGTVETVDCLLKSGAILNMANNDGERPADLTQDPGIAQLLEESEKHRQTAKYLYVLSDIFDENGVAIMRENDRVKVVNRQPKMAENDILKWEVSNDQILLAIAVDMLGEYPKGVPGLTSTC